MKMTDLYSLYEKKRADALIRREKIQAEIGCIDMEIKKHRDAIQQLNQEKEEVRSKLNANPIPGWIEIFKDLGKVLEVKTGKKCQVIGPFGLCSRCYIDLLEHDDDYPYKNPILSLEIEPDFHHEDIIRFLYCTGEEEENYPKGSIGAESGMNRKTAPLPNDIDEILKLFVTLDLRK